MRTTAPLHLVIDLGSDLSTAGDDTYRAMTDMASTAWDCDTAAEMVGLLDPRIVSNLGITAAGERAVTIGGVTIDMDRLGVVLADWLEACDRAWIAEAERQGHQAIAAAYSSPEADDFCPADEDPEAVVAAAAAVWDTVDMPTLADVGRLVSATILVAETLDVDGGTVVIHRFEGHRPDCASDDGEQATHLVAGRPLCPDCAAEAVG